MDFIHLFLPKEQITGIAIEQGAAYALAVKEQKKKKNQLTMHGHGTVPFSPEMFDEGNLVNVRMMSEKLRTLLRSTRPLPVTSPFIMASLPSLLFHFQSFTFPFGASGLHLEDAIQSQLGFVLPVSADLLYLDWERQPSRFADHREIFFVWARRSAIDPYLAAFRDAGLIPVAIEPQYMSVLRTLTLPQDAIRAIAIVDAASITTLVYDRGGIRFVRVVPMGRQSVFGSTVESSQSETPELIANRTIDALRRTMQFYESSIIVPEKLPRTCTIIPLVVLPDMSALVAEALALPMVPPELNKQFDSLSAIKREHRLHPAFGIARRTIIPRGKDTIVSMMPVGTEELYRRSRVVAFARFAHDFLITFSFYFAILFLFMGASTAFFIHQEEGRIARQSNFSLPREVGAWEREAAALTKHIGALEKVHTEQPNWGNLIRTMLAQLTPDIRIDTISAGGAGDVHIGGRADNLAALIALKKNLETSTLFERIDLPLNAFEQQTNIAFSLQLKVQQYQQLLFPKATL